MDGSALAFLGISIFVIATPGPDTALTIRNTLLGGRRGGLFTAFGVATGQLIWAAMTSAGVVALLLASEPVFRVVKLAGALYLIALGAHALAMAWRARGDGPAAAPGTRARLAPLTAFGHGVLNNLGNPKMAVFFASILPQFAEPDGGMLSALLLLGASFAALTLAWLAVYAVAVSAAGGLLRRPGVRRAVEGITGAALIGLGARLAAEGR